MQKKINTIITTGSFKSESEYCRIMCGAHENKQTGLLPGGGGRVKEGQEGLCEQRNTTSAIDIHTRVRVRTIQTITWRRRHYTQTPAAVFLLRQYTPQAQLLPHFPHRVRFGGGGGGGGTYRSGAEADDDDRTITAAAGHCFCSIRSTERNTAEAMVGDGLRVRTPNRLRSVERAARRSGLPPSVTDEHDTDKLSPRRRPSLPPQHRHLLLVIVIHPSPASPDNNADRLIIQTTQSYTLPGVLYKPITPIFFLFLLSFFLMSVRKSIFVCQ